MFYILCKVYSKGILAGVFSVFILLYYGCIDSQETENLAQVIYYFPAGLDPARNYDYYEYQIFSQIYEPLLKLGEDYETLEPCLAESWSVSDNEQDYILHLRSAVKFHDGSVLNAETACFSMMRQIKLRPDFHQFSIIDTVLAADSVTLVIKLKYPFSPFLYSLASPNGFMIMSRQAIEKYGDKIDKKPSGTGPFFLDEWIENELITLKRFPAYREVSEIEKITFLNPKHITKAEVLFKEGNLDILYMVAGFWLDRLRWLGNVEYIVQKPLNTLFIGFNQKDSLLKDPLIRKALLMSLDIKKIAIFANRGNALVAHNPLPPVFTGFNDLKQDVYDPEEAKKLLQMSGYKTGQVLNFYIPSYIFSRQTKIELIKSEIEQIGIRLNLKYFDSADLYRTAIRDSACQLFFDGYSADLIGDPGNFLYALFYSSSPYNWGGYQSAKTDQLLDSSFIENDNVKRHLLYREILKNVLNDVPAVYMTHAKSIFAYNSQKIELIAASPYEFIYYHRVKLRN